MLGPWKISLEHAIAHDEELAEDFASITSSCGATGYSYSSPPPYGSRTNTESQVPTPTSPGSEPSCESRYTVVDGDTCDSIAASQNVSTFGLIDNANLDIFCATLPKPGSSVCIPAQCKTHQLDVSDTCSSLAEQYGVSRVQLVSWNGNFDPQCLNIRRWRGTYVCVRYVSMFSLSVIIGIGRAHCLQETSLFSPPGNTAPEPMPEPTQVPVPDNASPDSNDKCSKWHTVRNRTSPGLNLEQTNTKE